MPYVSTQFCPDYNIYIYIYYLFIYYSFVIIIFTYIFIYIIIIIFFLILFYFDFRVKYVFSPWTLAQNWNSSLVETLINFGP